MRNAVAKFVQTVVYPDCGLLPKPLRHWDTQLPNEIIEVLPDDASPDVFPISRALGRYLAQLILHDGRRRVLELGAGASSLVLARALMSAGGGRLTSIDQSSRWCETVWNRVTDTTGVDAHLEIAQLALRLSPWPYFGFASAQTIVKSRGPFDLVLVDAPGGHYGRDGALPLLFEVLAPGALIVVDDAAWGRERWMMYRWLQRYEGLELESFDPAFGRHGVAVLRAHPPLTERRTRRGWVSGAVHAGVNCAERIRRRR